MKFASKKTLSLFCKSLALLPLYWLSVLIPRSRRIWVFGAWFGQRYSDNSHYVFDHVNRSEPGIRAIWLTRETRLLEAIRSEGREAYHADSLAGFWFACRAGATFVVNGYYDVNWVGACGSKIVQLWHGTPLKKIKLDDTLNENHGKSALRRLLEATWHSICPFIPERYDLITAPSEFVARRLQSAFGVPDDVVMVTGYARGDAILTPSPSVGSLDSLAFFRTSKVILFAPTHRQDVDFFADFDHAGMQRLLERHDAVLLVKMHFYLRDQVPDFVNDDSSRIRLLGEHEAPDINRLLPMVDVLVTDFSGVFYDYLLLDRPMIFTPFSMEGYLARERGLYEDYEAATPGPKCQTWEQVIDSLEGVLSGQDDYALQRKELGQKYNRFFDTDNSARIVIETKRRLGLV